MPRIAMGNSGCTRKINLFAHDDHLVFVNSVSENFEVLWLQSEMHEAL